MRHNIFFMSLGFAFWRFFSRIILRVAGFLIKPLPGGRLKRSLKNFVCSLNWPDIEFPAQKIIIGQTPIMLHPHSNEFDFEVLFDRTIDYEHEVFCYLSQQEASYDCVFDIGANVGLFSLYFSKRKHPSTPPRIYAFEPSVKAYQILLRNRALNHADTIYPFNNALGVRSGFCEFFEPAGHLTNGSLHKEFAQLFSRQVLAAPTFVIESALLESLASGAQDILIKIDAEASEPQILRNLEGFICRLKPSILLEVLPESYVSLNQLDFLCSGNYTVVNLTEAGPSVCERFVAGPWRNYFLTPKT